jgi:predicted HTH domain antitoxin
MTIEVSEQDLGALKLSPAEARLDFAVGMYTGRHLSMGRAAKVAGIPYSDFMRELGRRGICVNYSEDDFRHDLKVLESLRQKADDDRRQ